MCGRYHSLLDQELSMKNGMNDINICRYPAQFQREMLIRESKCKSRLRPIESLGSAWLAGKRVSI